MTAARGIGGIARPHVPAGAVGAVVEPAGLASSAVVEFRIPGGVFSRAETVRVEVGPDEVRPR
ncbi:hypothetical protein [Amycolatopsis rubida]|uniref:hypothetical protein n=1 Tax=Amycolatopsis rubida TaxID=112413 RepID=UPI00116010EA|nr:hypothetical protein [Amycolatopsis rubida]